MIRKFILRFRKAIKFIVTGEFANERSTSFDIPNITIAEVEEAKSFFPLSKFFVYGPARSGTTVLARLIRLHPDIHCGYQAHFFTKSPTLMSLVGSKEIKKWLSGNPNRWNRGKDLTPVVLRSISDYILERDARAEGAIIVGDKSTTNLVSQLAISNTHKIYPDAKIIFIVRDGRNTILSHRFQNFIDHPHLLKGVDKKIYLDFSKDSEPYFSKEKSIFSRTGLLKSAKNWVENINDSETELKKLYPKNYLIIRYEDLLEMPEIILGQLWRFLGASEPTEEIISSIRNELKTNHSLKWQMHKSPKLAADLVRAKEGSWSDLFTKEDAKLYGEIAGETLRKWKYSIK